MAKHDNTTILIYLDRVGIVLGSCWDRVGIVFRTIVLKFVVRQAVRYIVPSELYFHLIVYLTSPTHTVLNMPDNECSD